MASPVYIWFFSEVYFWRSLASITWSVLCLPVTMIIFVLLSGFSATHPYQWLCDTVAGVLSAQFWMTVAVLAICLIIVTWFSLPHFSVVPDVESSHLTSFLRLFRWSCLPLMVTCSLAGAISSWSLSRLIGGEFKNLTYVKKTEIYERAVLNEQHLFVVLAGIFSGLSYFRRFFQHQHFYLAFPNIQSGCVPETIGLVVTTGGCTLVLYFVILDETRRTTVRFKLFQMRSGMSGLLRSSVWQSLHTVKYFYICYFLFGGIPKNWIAKSFNIGSDPSATPVNSMVGLFSLTLFWQIYLVTLLMMFAWSLASMLLKIFHTEHLEFPIVSIMEHDKYRTLPEGLACSQSPLLQHLAFMDLEIVAKFLPSRRQELLSLSQPGGHPRIWASVSDSTLRVIKELSDRVREENWAIMSKVSINAQRNEFNTTYGSYSYPGDASSSLMYRGTEKNVTGTQDDPPETLKPSLLAKLYSLLQGLPFVSHLLAESPDISSRRLFASCQLQIWAVEVLSLMGAISYKEDKYGVIQNTLPAIFGTLLDLHEAIEKHFKLTTSIVRKPVGTSTPSDALLRYKLHSVNKAAIYRLVNTYRRHLDDLRLSLEYSKKLQPFVEYNV